MKVITTLLIAALLLSGCKTEIDKTVLLSGDSIMALAVPTLSGALLLDENVGYGPIDNAIIGSGFAHAGSAYGQYWAQRFAAWRAQLTSLPIVVFQIGYNDSNGDPLTAEQYAAAIDTIMASLHGLKVVWSLPWGAYGATPPAINTINTAIRTARGRYPNLVVVSFQDYLAARGQAIAEQTLPDGVHLTSDGQFVYSDFIYKSIKELAP